MIRLRLRLSLMRRSEFEMVVGFMARYISSQAHGLSYIR